MTIRFVFDENLDDRLRLSVARHNARGIDPVDSLVVFWCSRVIWAISHEMGMTNAERRSCSETNCTHFTRNGKPPPRPGAPAHRAAFLPRASQQQLEVNKRYAPVRHVADLPEPTFGVEGSCALRAVIGVESNAVAWPRSGDRLRLLE
jgi:hypothetical protein